MNQGYASQPHLHTNAPHRAALLTYPSNLQQALQNAQKDAKKILYGVANGIPSVYLTKVLASTKPDFVWIDAEHGLYSRLDLFNAIQAVQHHSEGKTFAIVRCHKGDDATLTTALDAGAAGIVIPHCEAAEEVIEMHEKIYYPPIGKRSFCPWIFAPGISDSSLYSNDPYNMITSNRHIALIPQIESVKGMDNLEEIAAIPQVSALMFGPTDYSSDAGLPGPTTGLPNPGLIEAMSRFSSLGRKYDKSLLGGALNVEMVPKMISQGYRAICVLFDNWGIAHLVHNTINSAKKLAENAPKDTE